MNRIFYLLLTFGLAASMTAQIQADFKPLRYDDDFSYLEEDTLPSTYEKIKYLPLGNKKHYLSVGGEIREQYIYTKNNGWGDLSDAPDGYLLSRYLLHADLKSGRFRTFIQLQSSLAYGIDNPSPVDHNTLDLHQAFIEAIVLSDEKSKLNIRAGRQELLYGSQRLIGVREGPNSRIAMDAAKLLYKQDQFQSDLFYAHPVANKPGTFNDPFNEKALLWGSYTVINNLKFLNNIDLYYLGVWKKRAEYDAASGEEIRHSLGFRVWKNSNRWKYDIEAVYQFGKLSQATVSAWTLSSNISYKATSLKFKPVFGLKSEIISGDKTSNDNKIQTFNPLYPRGAYFGLVALIGPANLFDIHPSLELEISNSWNLGIDYDLFWRWSTNDGLYAPNMQLLYSGQNTTKSFIGSQLAATIDYTPSPFLSLTLEGAWFDSGAFLKEAGAGKDYFYSAFTARIRF